jgi:hypothetical protein
MAEKVVLVCDVCGKPATQTVSIRIQNRNYSKDLCDMHVSELSQGARPARRGRPRVSQGTQASASQRKPKAKRGSGRRSKSKTAA